MKNYLDIKEMLVKLMDTDSRYYYLNGSSALYFAYRSIQEPDGIEYLARVEDGDQPIYEKNDLEATLSRLKRRFDNMSYKIYTKNKNEALYLVEVDGVFAFSAEVKFCLSDKDIYRKTDYVNSFRTVKVTSLYDKVLKDCEEQYKAGTLSYANLYRVCFILCSFEDMLGKLQIRRSKKLLNSIGEQGMRDCIFNDKTETAAKKEILDSYVNILVSRYNLK